MFRSDNRASRARAFAWAAAAILYAILASGAYAQDRKGSEIRVTGEASINAPPDLAVIRTGVTTQGKTAREAMDANSKTAAGLLASLRSAGIDDKDIQTSQLSLQPTYETGPGSGRGRINGFQASNQVTVIVHDISKLADVVDRVVGAGATNIGGIEFMVSTPSQLLDQARAEAVADARRKAEIYAKAAGVTLGRLQSLSEDQAFDAPVPVQMRGAMAAPPISPGEKTLRLKITASFEVAN